MEVGVSLLRFSFSFRISTRSATSHFELRVAFFSFPLSWPDPGRGGPPVKKNDEQWRRRRRLCRIERESFGGRRHGRPPRTTNTSSRAEPKRDDDLGVAGPSLPRFPLRTGGQGRRPRRVEPVSSRRTPPPSTSPARASGRGPNSSPSWPSSPRGFTGSGLTPTSRALGLAS